MSRTLRAYLVDDEALALKRLRRLLEQTGRVEVVGESLDPASALEPLGRPGVDVAFVDIQMPGMTGLELAARLPVPPWVVFVTAHDRYALRAFEVSALDYLVKPVRAPDLERALAKVERAAALPDAQAGVEAAELLARIDAALGSARGAPARLAARTGSRQVLVELARVTHFRADSKLTYLVTDEGETLEVTASLAQLEARLGPDFVRIHRAILVSLAHVREIDTASAAGACVRLRGGAVELPVARDRMRELRERIGLP